MKRSFKSVLGVTLLEIMLVLAIAAMVIVMSIRYYQSASLNQKIAATLNNITAVVAAGESYLAAQGTLAAASATTLSPYLPKSQMPNSAWGGAMDIRTPAVNSYVIYIPNIPTDACPQLIPLIQQNGKLVVTDTTACTTTKVTE